MQGRVRQCRGGCVSVEEGASVQGRVRHCTGGWVSVDSTPVFLKVGGTAPLWAMERIRGAVATSSKIGGR